MSKLTAVQIRQAKPKDKPYKLPDGQGLYFHVAESGKSTWRYRFRVDGKESICVLGKYPDMSLEQARKARAEAREQVKAGKNPSHERQKEKQAVIEQQKAEREMAEINLDAALWRIPGERMKMDSPHTVPLSRQAVAILERASVSRFWVQCRTKNVHGMHPARLQPNVRPLFPVAVRTFLAVPSISRALDSEPPLRPWYLGQ
jgi:hypothetical protein